MTETLSSEGLKVANDMAIKWFEIHADQRLKVFNFYLVISGFCIGGYFTAFHADNLVAATVVGLVLSIVSFCFKQLDRRTVQLTKLAEDYLNESLEKLCAQVGSENLNFVRRAEKKGDVWSYRKTFNTLFWLFGVLGVLGAFYPWLSRICIGVRA
ncbi:MAG: hypothetical protein KIT48_20785 [Pseudolabrys sp.]|nr:hypothetical protein [Pseudolabrys sp.]